jgi:fumarate hydratase subunit beta
MTTEHNLQLPVSKEQSRRLRVGDVVYLSGVVHTLRDMGHRRAVDMFRRGERLPFDLTNGALWHCGPIVRTASDGKWQVLSAGPTTSSRFNELAPELMRAFGVRCTIGKGTMGAEARDAMRKIGGFFLNATGGCGALYAGQVEEVTNVFWMDLGIPEAVWVLRVNRLGPLLVGIDCDGNSLADEVSQTMQAKLAAVYERSGIPAGRDLSYLPKRVTAKGSSKNR